MKELTQTLGSLLLIVIATALLYFGSALYTVLDAFGFLTFHLPERRLMGMYAVIDRQGNTVSRDPQVVEYKEPENRARKLPFTEHDGPLFKYHQVLHKGRKTTFFQSSDISEDLCHGQLDSGTGYVDRAGKLAFWIESHYAKDFHDGLAVIWDEKKGWRYVDRKGDTAIQLPPDCCAAEDFSEGLAAVALGGKDPLVFGNRDTLHAHASEIRPGCKWGFIDKKGKIVIEPQFFVGSKEVKSKYYTATLRHTVPMTHPRFSDGLAAIAVGNEACIKYGYVDKSGKWVVPPKFDYAEDFQNGRARIFSKKFWTW